MANMYNLNGLTYTAHENTEWFTRALFGGRLVQGGYIRVMTGVKGDELLSQIELENKVLQIDGKDCAWTPNQIIKLSEKKASVKTYKINLEQCIDDLENKRTIYQLSPGAKNESLPDELEAASLQLIAIALSNEIEEMVIGGDESKDPNQFNGMEKTLTDSTEAVKLVGATITKENVIGAVEAVYAAIPEEVLQAEDRGELFILGSYATRRKLRTAIAQQKKNDSLAEEWEVDKTDKNNPRIWYNGMEFIPVKGIGANTLIGYAANNAWLLTDLLSDLEEVELGQFPKPNDNKIWVKGKLRLGFVMLFEEEAVIWSDQVATAQGGRPSDKGLTVIPGSLAFKAAGETKVFNVVTLGGVTPKVTSGATGFTVTAGETSTAEGVSITPVTVVATSNEGNRDPRVGEALVSLPDTDRSVTVTFSQRQNDIIKLVP